MTGIVTWAARHVWIAWLLLLPVIWQGIDWALDRNPPFALLDVPPVVVTHRGQVAVYVVRVRRDLDRDCSVEWQRYIIDSQGVRHDFARRFYFTADELRAMSAAMGHEWLRVAVEIPQGMAPGPARIITNLHYVCNPLHELWPIKVSTILPLEVLP